MSVRLKIDKSLLVDSSHSNIVAEVSGNTVGKCLECVVKRQPLPMIAIFDENGNLCFGNYVMVNGQIVVSDTLAKQVKDGDEIEIFNFSGG